MVKFSVYLNRRVFVMDIFDMAESMNKIKILTIYERTFLRKAKFMCVFYGPLQIIIL